MSNKSGKTSKGIPSKRTPRTILVEEDRALPPIIPEFFSLKNFDLIGKVDDMRSLTKELSIMARQLEQWVGVFYVITQAFKDNGVLHDVIRAVSSVGNGDHNSQLKQEKSKEKKPTFPPPFPFFGGNEEEMKEPKESGPSENNPLKGINFLEIMNNPAFQEIISKLFLQNKR